MGHNHRGGVDCFLGSTAAAIVPHAKEIARDVIYSELFFVFHVSDFQSRYYVRAPDLRSKLFVHRSYGRAGWGQVVAT